MPGSNCVVKDCNNSYYRIKQWRDGWCSQHGVNFGVAHCTCDPPFTLYPFPKEEERRRQWIKLVSIATVIYIGLRVRMDITIITME